MPKIYLHYDGELGPGHTLVWQQESGSPFTERCLGDALAAFVRSYESKHGKAAYAGGMYHTLAVVLRCCWW